MLRQSVHTSDTLPSVISASGEHELNDARVALDAAVDRLRASLARDEVIAKYESDRRILGFRRRPTMNPIGRAWRLGVILLTSDAALRATGNVIRVTEPRRTSHPSNLSVERHIAREAAWRAGIRQGETVNYGTDPIELKEESLRLPGGVVLLRDDGLWVRWSAAGGDAAMTRFQTYLDDRVELLIALPRDT